MPSSPSLNFGPLKLCEFNCDADPKRPGTNSKEAIMTRIVLVALAVTAIAGVAAYMGSASGQSNGGRRTDLWN